MEDLAKHLIEQINSFLGIECHEVKELDSDKLDKLKNFFQFDEPENKIFYTNYNLIFLSINDFNMFEFIVSGSEVVFQLDVPEYSLHCTIMRYGNDDVFSEIVLT